MDKTYQPQTIEKKHYQRWEKAGYFVPQGNGKPYCITIPPPNVTGSLHMGHGLQDSLMDALIRYHRMSGDRTLWQVGTDHAGISTQMVVERQLIQEGTSRLAIGREKFVEKVWQWKRQSGGEITQQLRRMGASVDWSRECFTLDANMSAAVLEVFIKLYDEGLIYRGKKLVNWDPTFQSAISDLEVINAEEQGYLWHIRYPLVENNGYLVVATTRPETLLGDVAVAVHPEDQRYQHLIGQYCQLPLSNRRIPIIADEYVDQTFGSGCVKITPAHDFNDYEVGMRHHLPLINIFTTDARLNENAPRIYQGMDRFVAREKIIADLEQLNLIEKIEPHTLKVPRADRGNAIVEPYLTNQWFVKVTPLAKDAINAVKQGKIKFVPETWDKTYYQWLENIEDWCISRQLWWGHRIPAWYDAAGNIYVAKDESTVRQKYKLSNDLALHQDEDVLDTWFSSALWPFATLGWPEKTAAFDTFYPTSVLITGFDIIFFWVARMIMLGLKFTQDIPFKEVYFHGLIRDQEGQKMSKTKGNVLDPIDLIDGIDLESLIEKRIAGLIQPRMAEKVANTTRKEFPQGIPAFGCDALRFTYCALASTGRDIRFDINRLEGYRNFCNKIWNAARYVLMNLEKQNLSGDIIEFSVADQWIQFQLQQTIQAIHEHFTHYRFDLCAQSLYEFIWNEFCDWYLELSKPILMDPTISNAAKLGTRKTLIDVLETTLRLLHPMMPFITEEIWLQLKPYSLKEGESIMLAPFPQREAAKMTAEYAHSAETTQWLKEVIMKIRNIRGENNITPNKEIQVIIRRTSKTDRDNLQQAQALLIKLARLKDIGFADENATLPVSATAYLGAMEINVPLANVIDVEAEVSRLQKEIEKQTKDLQRSQAKLDNPRFTDHAPSAVVAEEKLRLQTAEDALQKLQLKLSQLASISKN